MTHFNALGPLAGRGTVRVRVVRSHVLGGGRFAEVGDILDLPEGVAIERVNTGAVVLAPPEPAPEAPASTTTEPPPTVPPEPAPEAPASTTTEPPSTEPPPPAPAIRSGRGRR